MTRANRRYAAGTCASLPAVLSTSLLYLYMACLLVLSPVLPVAAGNAEFDNRAASSASADADYWAMFAGADGRSIGWEELFAAMGDADIVIIGESHTDAKGHELQREMLVAATQRWDGFNLSLEEFDRSEQVLLDAYAGGDLSGADLKAEHRLVDPVVKKNWLEWFLPKLEVARDGGAGLYAANAPLKYSRMIRESGCDDLPELDDAELALFDCPVAPEDPAYKQRFVNRMTAIAARNKSSGFKQLQPEATDRMFRAHRVWDATMAQSIIRLRADTGKVVHIVGSFHSDFNGGLIQELRYRDQSSRILVICLIPKHQQQLRPADRGRADIVVYTH